MDVKWDRFEETVIKFFRIPYQKNHIFCQTAFLDKFSRPAQRLFLRTVCFSDDIWPPSIKNRIVPKFRKTSAESGRVPAARTIAAFQN
jgi:hypothetical protein